MNEGLNAAALKEEKRKSNSSGQSTAATEG